jgi:hypothetical protein
VATSRCEYDPGPVLKMLNMRKVLIHLMPFVRQKDAI